MACFLVPVAEAIITTTASLIMKSKAKKEKASLKDSAEEVKVSPFRKKLGWLSNMLWGGSVLLAFEHLWHGEIVPWFPFLTAAESAEETEEMLHEMSTVGVSMAVLVTAVWAGIVVVSSIIEKKEAKRADDTVKNN